jgi:hypothetical protein
VARALFTPRVVEIEIAGPHFGDRDVATLPGSSDPNLLGNLNIFFGAAVTFSTT